MFVSWRILHVNVSIMLILLRSIPLFCTFGWSVQRYECCVTCLTTFIMYAPSYVVCQFLFALALDAFSIPDSCFRNFCFPISFFLLSRFHFVSPCVWWQRARGRQGLLAALGILPRIPSFGLPTTYASIAHISTRTCLWRCG